MAGIFFTAGEEKKRAGVYQRYEKSGSDTRNIYPDGVVACVINATWGVLNEVVEIENASQVKEMFGTGGNVDVINQALAGGAALVRAIRIGLGGKKATAKVGGLTVTAKCVGTRALTATVKQNLEDENFYDFYIYENGVVLERFNFDASDTAGDVADKITNSSAYVTVVAETAEALISTCAGSAALATGENPTVSNSDYSNAFVALEPYRWNTICVDTNDVDVHALLASYMARVYQDGKTGIAVVGEPITVDFTTRRAHATAFNSYQVAYVGGGWYDASGVLIDGYKAAARIAGVIAAVPCNRSITHVAVAGAARPAEMMTNSQYEACIDSGMITFTAAPSGVIWIESGITTLVNPDGNDDAGWKKIKRVKARFELMDRVHDAVAPLVGQVNNDSDGRAAVIQVVQGVLNKMVSETKISDDALVVVDPDNAPVGDSAWFVITTTDIDSLEKVYFTYKFSFASAT